MPQRGYGGPRRHKNEEIFAGYQANSEQIDDFVLADKIAFHRLEHLARKPCRNMNWRHGHLFKSRDPGNAFSGGVLSSGKSSFATVGASEWRAPMSARICSSI